MSIWEFQNKTKNIDIDTAKSEFCCFCKSKMINIFSKELKHKKMVYKNTKYINICPICGWWIVVKDQYENGQYCGDPGMYKYYAKAAVLKKLDLDDINLPVEDVSKYLTAKYEERFIINPRLFEETVASVFRNMGYFVRVTAYQNDGGIDVILDGKDNKLIGVQVKRYKNSIRASQIREFAGALIQNGITNGIFVTTSKFQRGVHKSVESFQNKGIGIELYNSERFYDALQVCRLENNSYDRIIDIASKTKLHYIYYADDDLISYGERKRY